MSNTATQQDFPARADALPQVFAFVEARCAALGIARETALRLELIAEELFVNIVTHGYRGAAGSVTLAVRDAGADVELVAEDSASAFNPFADLDTEPEPFVRKVGGLGRVLVATLSARVGYERQDGRNRVTVAVPKVRPR